MYFTECRANLRVWNEKATQFLINTTWGRRIRIGLLSGTVVAYPMFSLLLNGPLAKQTFSWSYAVDDTQMPARIRNVLETEYVKFLAKNDRLRKDAQVEWNMCKAPGVWDTVAVGSLGVRTGLQLGLPFYLRFESETEALEYLKLHHPNGLEVEGRRVAVDWDSVEGQELAACFCVSAKALSFVALRDLYAHDGWPALAQRSISWVTWTTFTSLFTYWLHMSAKMLGSSALSFVCIYSIFVAAAWYANRHWHYLYRYVTDVYADSTAAHASFEQCEGGKEYYWKILKRNRLLREMEPMLYNRIKVTGDLIDIPTSLITRFDHLKDVDAEDDELREVVVGDD